MQYVWRCTDRWLRDPILRRARESTGRQRSAYIAQAAMRAPLRDGSRARRRQTQMAKRSRMQGGLRRSRAAPRCRRSPLVQAPVRRPRPATLFAASRADATTSRIARLHRRASPVAVSRLATRPTSGVGRSPAPRSARAFAAFCSAGPEWAIALAARTLLPSTALDPEPAAHALLSVGFEGPGKVGR
jgi:hypothetical protein